MKKSIIQITSGLLSLVILFFLFFTAAVTWNDFLNLCPSKDVLSWDANLRYITALDVYYNFREFNIVSALIFLLDSPTWPPLRTLFSLAGMVISGGPDTETDVFISTFFYILLFPSILYILYRMNSHRIHHLPLIFLLVASALLFSFEIKAYSVSSMLETQGMVFLLWAAYTAYRIREIHLSGQIPDKKIIYGFSVSFLGLFLTKYPYGLMFILAAFLYETASNYKSLIDLAKYLYKNHLKIFRIVYAVILAAGFIAILIVSPENKQALLRKLIYAAFVIVFIDFNILYYRFYAEINKRISAELSLMYRYGFLPALIWLGIHMDRFNSILDTQSHVQDADRSYLISFFNELFSLKIIPGIFLFAFIMLAVVVFLDLKRSRKKAAALSPILLPLTLILGQILLMEILTGNKQLRHIYHLIPAMAVFMFSLNPFALLKNQNELRFKLFAASSAASLVLMFLVYSEYNSSFKKTPLCFTGTDGMNYDAPRLFASKIDAEKKYLLYNNFHTEPFPVHGYAISTDFDILLYKKVFEGGYMTRYAKRKHYSINDFDRVLFISRNCKTTANFDKLIGEMKVNPLPVSTWKHEKTGFCMNEFSAGENK